MDDRQPNVTYTSSPATSSSPVVARRTSSVMKRVRGVNAKLLKAGRRYARRHPEDRHLVYQLLQQASSRSQEYRAGLRKQLNRGVHV